MRQQPMRPGFFYYTANAAILLLFVAAAIVLFWLLMESGLVSVGPAQPTAVYSQEAPPVVLTAVAPQSAAPVQSVVQPAAPPAVITVIVPQVQVHEVQVPVVVTGSAAAEPVTTPDYSAWLPQRLNALEIFQTAAPTCHPPMTCAAGSP